MKKTCTRIASVILALCIAAVNANITSGNVYAEGPSSSGIVLKADPSSRKIRHASESVCLMPGAEKTSVASGVITLYYDQDKVRVREVRKGSGLDSMMLDAGTSVPGKIVLGFASASPVEIKDTLADIDFEFETGYRGPLVTRWTVDELETDDSNGNSVSLDPDVLMVRQHGPGKGLSYRGEYTFTDTDGGIGLKLLLNEGIGESLVTNGVFTFTYDPDFLKYKDYAVYDKYPFLQYEVVNTEPGKVRIVCINNEPFTIKDTFELIRLEFYPLKNGSARISFDVNELSNVVSVDDITEYTGVTYTPLATSINISIPALDAPPSPTAEPVPTVDPTIEPVPTEVIPTTEPTEVTPTLQPTSVIPVPTVDPTIEPVPTEIIPTTEPTEVTPTLQPTSVIPVPTVDPTIEPIPTEVIPTTEPTEVTPTLQPTSVIPVPTVDPTIEPVPTEVIPTTEPTEVTPTLQPTSVIPVPTVDPTIEPVPTSVTAVPTVAPTTQPTAAPADNDAFDIDRNGAVNTLDLLKLIKIVIDPTAAKPAAADLNGDGNINSADVLELKKLLMK